MLGRRPITPSAVELSQSLVEKLRLQVVNPYSEEKRNGLVERLRLVRGKRWRHLESNPYRCDAVAKRACSEHLIGRIGRRGGGRCRDVAVEEVVAGYAEPPLCFAEGRLLFERIDIVRHRFLEAPLCFELLTTVVQLVGRRASRP